MPIAVNAENSNANPPAYIASAVTHWSVCSLWQHFKNDSAFCIWPSIVKNISLYGRICSKSGKNYAKYGFPWPYSLTWTVCVCVGNFLAAPSWVTGYHTFRNFRGGRRESRYSHIQPWIWQSLVQRHEQFYKRILTFKRKWGQSYFKIFRSCIHSPSSTASQQK